MIYYRKQCIMKEGESITLVYMYHPCAKFFGGQLGANMFEIACGQLCGADGHVVNNFCSQNFMAVRWLLVLAHMVSHLCINTIQKFVNPCQGWSTAYMQSEILSSLFHYTLLL